MQLKRSSITVNPKKAEEFLRLNTYVGQRNKSQSHVDTLAEKMKDGRFHNGQIALVHNGSTFLADGQHQCSSSIASGVTFPATLLEFTVEKGDSKEDIAQVFAQFNVDRGRSRGDVAWIYGCQIGMAEWPRKCVTLCNTALGWMAGGFGASGAVSIGKDECARKLSTHKKACEFVHDIGFSIDQKLSRHLLRSPVVAAMLTTFAKDQSDADVFWKSVRDGDMLKRSDPCFALREFLLRASVSIGAGAKARLKGEIVSQREMYGKCIVAWNAYRQKKTTMLKVFPNKPLPKAV